MIKLNTFSWTFFFRGVMLLWLLQSRLRLAEFRCSRKKVRILNTNKDKLSIQTDKQTNKTNSNKKEGALYAPPSLVFAFYSKYLEATHTWKFLTLQIFLLRMPLYTYKKIVFTLKYWSKNRPCTKGLNKSKFYKLF